MTIKYNIISSVLGKLSIASTEKGICFLCFIKQENLFVRELRKYFPNQSIIKNNYSFYNLIEFIKNPNYSYKLRLDIQGTEFQKKVWQTLLEIPFGETRSYKEIAEKIGKPSAVRAVSNAIGANKIAVLIPCHRVIGSNGKLYGYKWGIEIKQKLLDFEKNALS